MKDDFAVRTDEVDRIKRQTEQVLEEARSVGVKEQEEAGGATGSTLKGGKKEELLRRCVKMYRSCVEETLGGCERLAPPSSAKGAQPAEGDMRTWARGEALSCLLNGSFISLQIGEKKEAEELCEMALSLDKEHPLACFYMAQAAMMRGAPPDAKKIALWLKQAKENAEKRGDKNVLDMIRTSIKGLEQPPKKPAPLGPLVPDDTKKEKEKKSEALEMKKMGSLNDKDDKNPMQMVQAGIRLLREKKRPKEAIRMLNAALTVIDGMEAQKGEEKVGPEASSMLRISGFLCLEALVEAQMVEQDFEAAVCAGKRGIELGEALLSGGKDTDAAEKEKEERGKKILELLPEKEERLGVLMLTVGQAELSLDRDPSKCWARARELLGENCKFPLSKDHPITRALEETNRKMGGG